MMAKMIRLLTLALLAASPAFAEPPTPQKAAPRATFDARPEPGAIPLYPDAPSGEASTENWLCLPSGDCTIRNVTRPNLTPVLPEPGIANGAAVVVLPGGGFMSLAIDHEGHKVARALADRGITAFVLKYRLIATPADPREAQTFIGTRMKEAFAGRQGPQSLFNPDAVTDAAAALRYVRDHSSKWGVDPERVGLMGFSAGARTTLKLVLGAAPADAPRFFGYIYGDMGSQAVPAAAPPMFAAIAFDDNLYPAGNLALAQDWHRAGRKVELHVYQSGGHGFGLGRNNSTNALLIDEFTAWLSMQGLLKPQAKK
jgi:acetyl esterase/lipase